MNKFSTPERTKLTVRIIKPILEAFNSRTEEACIRRDALINKALEIELPRIRQEINRTNSARARSYIQAKLKSLFAINGGGSLLTLALSSGVAHLLEQICEEKNISRDTLMNRLLLLLGAPGQYLETRMYPLVPFSWIDGDAENTTSFSSYDLYDLSAINKDKSMLAKYSVSHYAGEIAKIQAQDGDFDKVFSPIGRVGAIISDPLYSYRTMLSIRKEEDRVAFSESSVRSLEAAQMDDYFYTPFGYPFDDDDWDGLNCVIDDRWLDQKVNHGPVTSK